MDILPYRRTVARRSVSCDNERRRPSPDPAPPRRGPLPRLPGQCDGSYVATLADHSGRGGRGAVMRLPADPWWWGAFRPACSRRLALRRPPCPDQARSPSRRLPLPRRRTYFIHPLLPVPDVASPSLPGLTISNGRLRGPGRPPQAGHRVGAIPVPEGVLAE